MEIMRIIHVTVSCILSHPTEKPIMHKVPMLMQKCVNVVRNRPQCSMEYTTVAAIFIAPLKLGTMLLPGVPQSFSGGVMSCAALQTSKRTPEVFFMMAEKLGSSPAETIVFEDALYAADTAKRAGFSVAAVYDPSEKNQDALRETADWYCRSWKDLPLEIL